MEGYESSSYGDRIAPFYDAWYEGRFDVAATVETLGELAAGGRALELGIGTGRVAIPLAERGITVVGIDSSEAMVARMAAKVGAGGIEVLIGDLADVGVDGLFRLIYVPFNTFFAITDRERQIACLRNVAAHLEPGGCFAVDAFVPDMTRFRNDQSVTVDRLEAGGALLSANRHNPVDQTIEASHIALSENQVSVVPVCLRYVWPSELDLMARLAGLRLKHRWGDYSKTPFNSESTMHVSLYGLAPAGMA